MSPKQKILKSILKADPILNIISKIEALTLVSYSGQERSARYGNNGSGYASIFVTSCCLGPFEILEFVHILVFLFYKYKKS